MDMCDSRLRKAGASLEASNVGDCGTRTPFQRAAVDFQINMRLSARDR